MTWYAMLTPVGCLDIPRDRSLVHIATFAASVLREIPNGAHRALSSDNHPVNDCTTPLLTVTVPALESLGDCRLDEGS
jgi:hypothetical protein